MLIGGLVAGLVAQLNVLEGRWPESSSVDRSLTDSDSVTLLLGIFFSLAIGLSDFFGGFATRRSQALTVVVSAVLVGALTTPILMLFVDSEFLWQDIGLGALSGSTLGFALVLMYRGMAESSAAVVSPIVAVLSVLIQVGYDLATGATLPLLVVLGIAAGVLGLALATISPELGDRVLTGVRWALASGICFGVTLTVLGQTSAASGLWGAFSQRATAAVVLAVVAAARGVPRLVDRSLAKYAILSGFAGALGIAAFTSGAQRGSLSEIAVAASMFPAVTAVLSAMFDDHPLRWWQMLGIGGCVAGISMIGVG